MSYQGCLRTHTGRRGRSFTAGVAAADDNDVESMDHQNLGWHVLKEVGIGVKIIAFYRNVSRETFDLGQEARNREMVLRWHNP
jgi:hypothetical protein